MRYYLDTEFLDTGSAIDLISIAVVSENGAEYYAINQEFDWSKASSWLLKHVQPQLESVDSGLWKPRATIRDELLAFVDVSYEPQFWGYYADYDWVIMCQLFGRMLDLPPKWPKLCYDLKQIIKLANIKVAKQVHNVHHCLHDARWIRKTHEHVRAIGFSK